MSEETKKDKWERGKTLFLESVHKPDHELRGCAHNQQCFHELMEIREEVIKIVQSMDNPHCPPVKIPFCKKNNEEIPTVTTPSGEISETLYSGTLGPYYDRVSDE